MLKPAKTPNKAKYSNDEDDYSYDDQNLLSLDTINYDDYDYENLGGSYSGVGVTVGHRAKLPDPPKVEPDQSLPTQESRQNDLEGLPEFLVHPGNAYVIRGKSAEMTCTVTSADKAYFMCNGEAMGASSSHKEVDKVVLADEKDLTGRMITIKVLTLDISRNQIEELFAPFTCSCDAWNSKGKKTSKNATASIACK